MLPVLLAVAAPAQTTPWWDPAWTGRTMLRFDRIDETPVRKLVVLVRLEEGYNFAHGESTGDDLRFVDPNGLPLDYELEAWDPSGESRIWVRVPRILDPQDRIWMYHGNPGAPPGADPVATWRGWDLVLHLDDPEDPRGSGGFLVGQAGVGEGVLGGGLEVPGRFGGLVSRRSSGGEELTVTAQVLVPGWTPWAPVQWAVSGGPRSWALGRCTTGASASVLVDGWQVCGATPVDDGEWHAIAATYDEDRVQVYLDGALEGETPGLPNPPPEADRIVVGNGPWLGAGLGGVVDEVRVTSQAHSAAWLAADARSLRGELVSYCNDWIGQVRYVADLDGDGAIGDAPAAYGCEPPEIGWVPIAGQALDCDDGDATVYPGAPEPRGDPVDRDCDGLAWSSRATGGHCGCGGSGSSGWLALVVGGWFTRHRGRSRVTLVRVGPT